MFLQNVICPLYLNKLTKKKNITTLVFSINLTICSTTYDNLERVSVLKHWDRHRNVIPQSHNGLTTLPLIKFLTAFCTAQGQRGHLKCQRGGGKGRGERADYKYLVRRHQGGDGAPLAHSLSRPDSGFTMTSIPRPFIGSGVRTEPWFSAVGDFASPGGIWQYLKAILTVTTRVGKVCYWHLVCRGQGATQHPTLHRTAPQHTICSPNIKCCGGEALGREGMIVQGIWFCFHGP